MQPLALRTNFVWTLVGNVVYTLSQWGMMVALAKFGSPEVVGRFALGLAITAPVILFTGLALRSVQVTDARKIYQFCNYLGLRLTTTVIGLLFIIAIVMVGNYSGETGWVILLIGLAKAFEAVSDIYHGLFQQNERMDRVATSMMIKGPLSLIALTLAMIVIHRVWAGTAALAFVWALVLVFYDIPNSKAVMQEWPGQDNQWSLWNWPVLFRLARLSFPLGLTMMLISLNTNIPRYFIERCQGERELGLFAPVAYLMVIGTMVVNALGQSASPRMASYYANRDKRNFALLLMRLLGIGVVLGVLGILLSILAGKEILILLYQKEYGEFNNVLVWVMVASTLSYIASFLGYAMTAARYFAIQPVIFFAVAMANALSCFFLVPLYGALGAAWALGIANLLQLLLCLAVVVAALYRIPYGKSHWEGVLYELER